MATMMSAVAVGSAGIDSIELREVAVPQPGPGEALVRLSAASLNFRDLLFVTGRLPNMTKTPDYVPLSDGVGEVVEVGAGVTRVKPGERVQPIFALGWLEGPQTTMAMLGGFADGTARQFACFPAESLVRVPDNLGDLEAATLTCAGLTAWNALFQPRPLQAGEWVLCQGTGGVSIAALQFAKAAGARVAITSSSNAKLARARALGADLTVNYRSEPDWAGALRCQLDGERIAILVDVVGASEIEAAASLLGEGSVISAIGMLGESFSWGREQVGGHRVARISVGNRTEHEAMLAFIETHALRPVVDVVYDLARITDAYRHLESGRFFGKIGVSLL